MYMISKTKGEKVCGKFGDLRVGNFFLLFVIYTMELDVKTGPFIMVLFVLYELQLTLIAVGNTSLPF